MRSNVFLGLIAVLWLSACHGEQASPTSGQKANTNPPSVRIEEPWVGKAFDGETVRLNSPARFYQEIVSARNQVAKGQFETTADYERRKAELPLPTGIGAEKIYLFEFTIKVKYDADQGAYVGDPSFCTDHEFTSLKNTLACRLASVEGEPLINRRDVYGQTQLFEKRTDIDYSVLMSPADVRKIAKRSSQYASYTLPSKCSFPIEEAKKLGPIAMAYGVKFDRPDFVKGETMHIHEYPEYTNIWDVEKIGVYGRMTSLVCYTNDQHRRIIYQQDL
ncbi:hypothetical protein [Stenotrophomonas maltophilia]